jgi:hypothetical protein
LDICSILQPFGVPTLWTFGVFYNHLVYFMHIWYVYVFCVNLVYFSSFDMLYQEKSGNPALDIVNNLRMCEKETANYLRTDYRVLSSDKKISNVPFFSPFSLKAFFVTLQVCMYIRTQHCVHM